MLKVTPTLVRLHVEQGYLGKARAMLDSVADSLPEDVVAVLEEKWQSAAVKARRQARISALKGALARIRRRRTRLSTRKR